MVVVKGIPDLGDSGLYWINEVENTIYDIVTRLQPNKYLTDSSISVVANTNEYPLPATFKSLSVNGAGLFVFDSTTGQLTETLNETFRGSPQRGYWINEKTSKLVLTPPPG